MSLSLLAAIWVGRWDYLARQNQFQQHIANLTTALQRSVNRYNELLLSVADLYVASTNQVSQDEFHRFVQRSLASYPGIQALEWAPIVPRSQRIAYERALVERWSTQALGIVERGQNGEMVRAGDRPVYVPVTYIEPWLGNEIALGYDLASDASRREALDKAKATGEIAATRRIRLVQETAQNQYSFLVMQPVFHQAIAAPHRPSSELNGYVLGVFRVADVVEESLQDLNYDIDFYIHDQTAPPDEQFLGFYDSSRQQVVTPADEPSIPRLEPGHVCPTVQDCTHTLHFGQRDWRILFLPAPSYPTGQVSWGAIATLVTGLVLTGSLLVYLSRSQAELARTRELSELKLRFFSMASHELRTPLSILLVTAQSLAVNRQQLSDTQQTRALERIQTAAKRMTQLLSDILTLTRAEAGKLDFAPELLDLNSLCWQIVDAAQASAKPGQHIQLQLPPTPCDIYCDPKLLHSILLNLLSNASKYSPEHSKIDLIVHCDAQAVCFQVVDRGMGIPPDARAHLFNPFYRGTNVGDIPGTGLGLAVVKTCVHRHNGTLDLDSTLHQGTTVTVSLPR